MTHLYETDLLAWSERQAELLRRLAACTLDNETDLDWPNLAEEIDSLGHSERSKLRSHIAIVLEHLIKLQASLSTDPRNESKDTIDRARNEIARVVEDSPSLLSAVGSMIDAETKRSGRMAARSLERYGEEPGVKIDTLKFSAEQVMEDWYPEDPL